MFGRKRATSTKYPGSPFTKEFRAVIALSVLAIMTGGAAWFTHVVTCLIEERWGFLIAGAIAFPIAVVHGIMIWFGLAG